MKTVTLINPMEDPRWDEFVENHPFGWICHLSGWKRVLEESFKHIKGYYFILQDSEGSIQAGLPVFHVKSWITGNRLVSIPFATMSDPLVSSRDEMAELLEAAKSLGKDLGVSYIEIRASGSCDLIERNEKLKRIDRFKQHILLLEGDSNSLMKRFHKTSVQQRIKRVKKININIRIGKDDQDINSFYCLYCGTRKLNGLPALPLLFIQSIFEEFLANRKVQLLIVELDSRPVAAMLLYRFKERVASEFFGWNRKYSDAQPGIFSYWEAIKMAQEEGYRVFDFGRTAVDNQNLMNFKNNWGTDVTDLPQFYYPVAAGERISKEKDFLSVNLAKRAFRSVPGILYLPLGNFFYRHIG